MDIDSVLPLGGVATRDQLVGLLGRHRFDNAVKSRRLVPIFPRTYAYPWDADQPEVRHRAALLSVGGDAALSHLSALALRDLPVPVDASALHVTAYQPRHPRGVPDELVVHRTLLPLDPVELDGLPVVRTELAIATSWPLLAGPDQRAPAIEAWRRRLISRQRLYRAAESMWWLREVRSFRELVSLLLAGCESELELWGYTGVFDVPGLRDATRQRIVRVHGKKYRLDLAYDDERLNIELDGRAYHSSPQQWERDIARDLALATAGWQTIRFSHAQLFGNVDGCRRDALAVRAARRALAS